MFFNRAMFAAAKTNAGRQNKWYPVLPGRRLARVIKLKEVYGTNGNYWIGEFEVAHSDVDEKECGRKFDIFVDLANANQYAEKDYGKMKTVELVIGGYPVDIAIESEEDEAEFGVFHDNLLSTIEFVESKKTAVRGRADRLAKAEGAIVGFSFVTPKGKDGAEPKNKTLRWYPYAPFLPRGASISQDDYTKVVLEDGSVMERLAAVMSVLESRKAAAAADAEG